MTQYVLRVHPSVLIFLTKPCPHFDLGKRMGIRSLIVSVRLNDSTYFASSLSAFLQTVESAQACTHTHTHLEHTTICNSYLLLVLVISMFAFIFCPVLHLRIHDFMTHGWCLFHITVTSHVYVSVHSVFTTWFYEEGMSQLSFCRICRGIVFPEKNVVRSRLDGVGNENI